MRNKLINLFLAISVVLLPQLLQAHSSSKGGSRKKSYQMIDSVQKQKEAPSYNPVLDRNRLMLLDAVIELNHALLQGVQASIDSMEQIAYPLNTSDKRAMALFEKRMKEREELLPYMMHILDSLKKDSQTIMVEKQAIYDRLNPPVAEEVKPEIRTKTNRTRETKKQAMTAVSPTEVNKEKQVITAVKEPAKIIDDAPMRKNEIKPTPVKWEAAIAIDTVALVKYEAQELQQPLEKVKSWNRDADTVSHVKSDFFLKRAQKSIADKQISRAYYYLDKSLALWDKNYQAILTMADLDAENNAHSKALKGYERAMLIDTTQAALPFKIGKIYFRMKKRNDAWRSFSHSIRLDNKYVPAIMERAAVSFESKNYSAAITDYTAVLEINSNYHLAYRFRGIARLMDRNFVSATEDFTRFLIFDQSDASVYYYRGLAKIGNNDWLEGCLDLSTAADMGYTAAQKVLKKNCE